MLSEKAAEAESRILISRAAHVVERTGLAMAGAMSGTFVSAYLARAGVEPFDSVGFIASMVLMGMIGFYLGIDIPAPRASDSAAKVSGPGVDPVELLSATGTFLAAVAALASVYAIVFDEVPQRLWEVVIGSWWLLGIVMQVSAGLIGRSRLASKAVG
jgi:uncharacterized membrane protein YfcA